MKMLKVILSAAAFVALFSGQSVGHADTIAVTKDFNVLDLKWNGGQITTYRGRWSVIVDKSGYIAVCGAGQMLDSTSAQATMTWLRSISISLDKKKILMDMSFFTKLHSNEDVGKAKASCKSTKTKAPRKAFSVLLSSPPAQAKF